jgi:hypothetical protein
MTAVLTRPEATAHVLVVLVAPQSKLHECDAAIERTVLAGAQTVTCEVDPDERRFAEAVSAVLGAVDDAAARFPGLPIVLVGHAAAGAAASLAAEACGDDIAGLVLTHQHTDAGPVRHAA